MECGHFIQMLVLDFVPTSRRGGIMDDNSDDLVNRIKLY